MWTRTLSILTIVIGAAFFRLVPHLPNMTPVLGLAVFAGSFADKRLAIIAPFVALLLSDVVLGFYPHMEVVYAAVVLVTALSFCLGKNPSALRIGCVTVCCSFLFYLLTNAGVWALDGLYPLTLYGLVTCYVIGLPFLGNQLVGDVLTVVILFGGFRLLERPDIVGRARAFSGRP